MIGTQALLQIRWNENFSRTAEGAPLISPLFVAAQGLGIRIADTRPREQATGVLGYIPGSAFCGAEQLERSALEAADAPLVLVSATGNTAAELAKHLEEKGAKNVAAMQGGIGAWRTFGFGTSRDTDGVRDDFQNVTASKPGPLTLEHVREHVGDSRAVRWIKLTSMITHGRISCIDGRDERGVVGVPGGDAGEFLLFLAAVEQTTGREMDDDTVTQGLLARLDLLGHFCMHTDVHAFEALVGALSADQLSQSAVSGLQQPEEWARFLHDPAPDLQEVLLRHLVDPAHIGCGHIRLMLQHSDEYGIRKELVVSFLRAFYHLWWAGSPELDLTTLPGDHGEGAVVNICLADDVWSLTRVPLVSPECGGEQMFVNHPDIANYLRKATVRYLASSDGPLSVEPAQQGKLQETVDGLAARQLGATAGYLAKGLPVFEVVFAKDGSFDVRGDS